MNTSLPLSMPKTPQEPLELGSAPTDPRPSYLPLGLPSPLPPPASGPWKGSLGLTKQKLQSQVLLQMMCAPLPGPRGTTADWMDSGRQGLNPGVGTGAHRGWKSCQLSPGCRALAS